MLLVVAGDVEIDPAKRDEAIEAAYEHGHVNVGDIDIPLIDWRNYLEDDLDMHNSHQSFASRQRLLDHDGAVRVGEIAPQRRLDQQRADDVLAVGHSRGTSVWTQYLDDATYDGPDKVAKYVNQ